MNGVIKIKKVIKYIIILLLIVSIAISSFLIYKNLNEDKKQEDIFEEIKDIAQESPSEDNKEELDNIDMKKLYEINSDIVAWLRIDNTNINYPIMQTKENKNFYLRKNFYKQYSYLGTPYLSENCDIKTSDNLIIYGHHINNSKMFGELENYKNKNYYEEHKKIQLFTLEEKQEYEVIAVFKTIAHTGFKYYNFINANNEGEFNTFLNKCKELSFFDTENTAVYGDKLLTLSTCEYSLKNGRLVIVAKQINNKTSDTKNIDKDNEKEETTIATINKSNDKITTNIKEEQSKNIQTEEKNARTIYKEQTTSYDKNAFVDGHLKSYPLFEENYATLKISKIGVNAPIYFGATDEILLKGVAHDTGSYLFGENGTIILCGHNYMNNFKRLRRIKK